MDIEKQLGLSRKSRGILFKLKKTLTEKKISLQEHICNIFQFHKTSFKKKQFNQIIKKYDNRLVLNELDELFDDLDENRNDIIPFQRLKEVYKSIDKRDDPSIMNRSEVIRSSKGIRSSKNLSEEAIIDIYTQVRNLLTSSEDLYEILYLFDTERNGFLSGDTLIQILNNFGYKDEKKKKIFVESMLQNHKKIFIDDLLIKLDLQNQAKRINVNDISLDPSVNDEKHNINQSQFIKDQIKEGKIQFDESVNVSKIQLQSLSTQDYISIEKIPQVLRPYFNYGSQLQNSFAQTAVEYISCKQIFIDHINPPYSQAYQWVHLAEFNNDNYQLFQMAKSVLFRDKQRKGLAQLLEPKDIIQGNLGDCYFLSAVAGIVEKYPELIYKLFVLQKNPSHIYGVRLFIDGSWKTIVLDACFPVNRHFSFCGAQPHHQQIWVMLLQKAWAKVFSSYDNIHSGYNEEGLNAVSGAPSIYVSAKQGEFVKRIEIQLKRGSIITCATSAYVSQMLKSQQDQLGIYSNHAYSLLNVYSNLKIGDGHVITLFKVRNPWGRKEWQGRWAFRDQQWTPALRNKLDYNINPHDGSFFMSETDFIMYFDHVNICRINLAFKNSWIDIHSQRDEFNQTRFKVLQSGDYYFTIYQENPRKYKGLQNKRYQKSKSWIFLSQQRGGELQAIGSASKDNRDNTIEVSLKKGDYVLLSKVQWKLWDFHNYCITSYGPETIQFKKKEHVNLYGISDFIQSKAKLGFGKKSFYENKNILKRIMFSPEEGYGFILFNNQEPCIFEVSIWFPNCKGIVLLPPYSMPIHLQIFPGQEIVCKFLVDPQGYKYSIQQSYKFVNLR